MDDAVQRSRIGSGEIIAGRLRRSVVGGNLLHEPVTGCGQLSAVIIQISIRLSTCTAGISTRENAYGVHGSFSGFDRICH